MYFIIKHKKVFCVPIIPSRRRSFYSFAISPPLTLSLSKSQTCALYYTLLDTRIPILMEYPHLVTSLCYPSCDCRLFKSRPVLSHSRKLYTFTHTQTHLLSILLLSLKCKTNLFLCSD